LLSHRARGEQLRRPRQPGGPRDPYALVTGSAWSPEVSCFDRVAGDGVARHLPHGHVVQLHRWRLRGRTALRQSGHFVRGRSRTVGTP